MVTFLLHSNFEYRYDKDWFTYPPLASLEARWPAQQAGLSNVQRFVPPVLECDCMTTHVCAYGTTVLTNPECVAECTFYALQVMTQTIIGVGRGGGTEKRDSAPTARIMPVHAVRFIKLQE